jgi:hypothetical protein
MSIRASSLTGVGLSINSRTDFSAGAVSNSSCGTSDRRSHSEACCRRDAGINQGASFPAMSGKIIWTGLRLLDLLRERTGLAGCPHPDFISAGFRFYVLRDARGRLEHLRLIMDGLHFGYRIRGVDRAAHGIVMDESGPCLIGLCRRCCVHPACASPRTISALACPHKVTCAGN